MPTTQAPTQDAPRVRSKISRRMKDTLLHLGRERPIIVTLDMNAGTVSVRLLGCRNARLYFASDLARFPTATPQLGLPLSFIGDEEGK